MSRLPTDDTHGGHGHALMRPPPPPPRPHDNGTPLSSGGGSNNADWVSEKNGLAPEQRQGNGLMLTLPVANGGFEVQSPTDDEWVYGFTLLERAKARTQKQRADAARPTPARATTASTTRSSASKADLAAFSGAGAGRSPPAPRPSSDAYGRALLDRAKRWRQHRRSQQQQA